MSEVITQVSTELLSAYVALVSLLPENIQIFVNFLSIVILLVLFAVFVWKFYQSVSTKDIIHLDLSQYKTHKNPNVEKSLAVFFYIIKYIVIFPILIFVWFALFTIFLILLTDGIQIDTILILSATVIAAIRLTSYYKKQLSEDLAKLIPFTLLAVSLLDPSFFSIERVFMQLQDLTILFGDIFIYLFFIIGVEIILRAVDFVFGHLGLKDEQDKVDDKEEDEDEENEQNN